VVPADACAGLTPEGLVQNRPFAPGSKLALLK